MQKELEALPSESVFPTLLEIMQSQKPQEQNPRLATASQWKPRQCQLTRATSDLPTQRY
ncbi:hypothetical protein [Helicobacter cinaedi]|uniref:hypothetical protein n=1 Tax=Helicobacter cinaedi TaxID=213 RepID=UPI0015F0F556|nr:hypothetical protein [Helicobacter cinaedi]